MDTLPSHLRLLQHFPGCTECLPDPGALLTWRGLWFSIADHPSAEVPSTASQMLLILHMGPPTWWSSSPPHPAGALVSHQSSCPHSAWSLTPCAEQTSYMDGLIPSLGLWLPFWVTVALSLFCWHGCLSCLVPPPSFWTNLFRKKRKEGKNRMIL